MESHTLREGDWKHFIQDHVAPLCVISGVSTVFALVGELGAGKTTFSKTFLHALGVGQHVQSPTFSIINSYDISFNGFEKVYHIDVYRIEDIKELMVLHFKDVLNDPKNIVVIEWADKIKELIPASATWMYFGHDTTDTRKVSIQHGKK